MAKLQHIAEVFVGHHDRGLDARLLDVIDKREVGHVGGVVQLAQRAIAHVEVVDDRGRGGDQIKVVFPLKPVTHHFEVQQAKEAAAKAKAERGRGFHFRSERGVVEGKLFDRLAQRLKIGGVNREEAAEHHRLRRFETGQRGGAGVAFVGDGVAHAGIADLLDLRGEHADLAGAKFGDIDHFRLEHGKLFDAVGGAGLHHLDAVAAAHGAIHDPHHHHNAEVGIIPAINQHRLEGRRAVALGGGQAGDDGFQHVRDAKARFGRDENGVMGIKPDHILDLLLDAVRLGGGQVDLVQHRHDFVAGIKRVVDVGQGLRLDALRGIDHQQRAFDGAHASADFVGKINVAGGVDQIENVGVSIAGLVFQPHGLRLDGDAALALDIHAVKDLRLHVAVGDGAGRLDQPVSERGFAVVDMRHDGEVADAI